MTATCLDQHRSQKPLQNRSRPQMTMPAEIDPAVDCPQKRIADLQGAREPDARLAHLRPVRALDQVARAEVVDHGATDNPQIDAKATNETITTSGDRLTRFPRCLSSVELLARRRSTRPCSRRPKGCSTRASSAGRRPTGWFGRWPAKVSASHSLARRAGRDPPARRRIRIQVRALHRAGPGQSRSPAKDAFGDRRQRWHAPRMPSSSAAATTAPSSRRRCQAEGPLSDRAVGTHRDP